MTNITIYYQKVKMLARIYCLDSTKAIIRKEKRGVVPWTSCAEMPHCNLPYHEPGLCEPILFLLSWSHDWQVREEMLAQQLKDEYKYHFPSLHLRGERTRIRVILHSNSSTSLRTAGDVRRKSGTRLDSNSGFPFHLSCDLQESVTCE